MNIDLPVVGAWVWIAGAVAAILGFFSFDWRLRKLVSSLSETVESSFDTALSGPSRQIHILLERVAASRRQATLLLGVVTLAAALSVATSRLLPLAQPLIVYYVVAGAFVAGAAFRTARALTEVSRLEAEVRALLTTRTRIQKSVGDDVIDRQTIVQQAAIVREEDRFSRNLGAAFELKQIELAGTGIFRDLIWTMEPGVNLLLGRNGYGKSFLLRLLVSMLSNDAERLNQLAPPDDPSQRLRVLLLRDEEPASIERQGPRIDSDQGKIPVLAIPDSRFVNRARTSVGADDDGDFADLARHGAHHFLRDMSFDSTINTVLAQMCIEALEGKPRGELPSTPQLDLVARLVRDLSGEGFRFLRIEPAGNARFAIFVETDSSPGKPISIQQASQGTLSVVAICALIYQFLRRVHATKSEAELCVQPGIVVIDEVDAHLHPAWQRKIVHLLRTYFPKVQFILTAHSPLVVAGCGEGEVSVLRREADGLNVREFQRDFIGATPQDIYREVFEIKEADATYLGLQAQRPELQRLNRELEALRSSGADDEAFRDKERKVEAIRRTSDDQDTQMEVEALRRENEQLRRQIEALRISSTGSSAA